MKGFTLSEIIVVILITGILISMVSYAVLLQDKIVSKIFDKGSNGIELTETYSIIHRSFIKEFPLDIDNGKFEFRKQKLNLSLRSDTLKIIRPEIERLVHLQNLSYEFEETCDSYIMEIRFSLGELPIAWYFEHDKSVWDQRLPEDRWR